jgi:hypothetical protein
MFFHLFRCSEQILHITSIHNVILMCTNMLDNIREDEST